MTSSRIRFSRRAFLGIATLASTGALAAACAPAVPPTVTPVPPKPAEKPTAPPVVAPTATPVPAPTATTVPAPTKPAAPPPTATAPAPAKVRVIVDSQVTVKKEYIEWIDKSLAEKYPNIAWENRPLTGGSSDIYGKMYAMASAGTLGDVFNFHPAHWEFYRAAKRGISRSIDDLIAADKFDLGQFYKAYVDMQRWEGKLWGLPCWGFTSQDTLWWNLPAVKEAGVTVPDHNSPAWKTEAFADTIRDAAFKMNKTAGGKYERYGIDIDVQNLTLTCLVRAFNADLLSPDGKKSTVTEPRTAKALRWIWDLAHKDKVLTLPGTYEVLGSSGVDLFLGGKFGLYVQSVGLALGTYKANPKVGEVAKPLAWPRRPDGLFPSQVRGGSWNINAKSKQPEAAFQFLKSVTSRDGAVVLTSLAGSLGLVRPDVFDDPYYTTSPLFVNGMWKDIFANAMPVVVIHNFRGTEFTDAWNQSYPEFILGNSGSFEESLEKLNASLQRVLDKPGD
ncbi:MAG: extracellular solute-binding protein [Chloroflexi bacterium]|nr:extracellular solute-binding protein [Chloroflexota bacterium]